MLLRTFCISILVIILAIVAALFLHDPHIDFRIKLMQQAMRIPYWRCGIYGNGTDFNRQCITELMKSQIIPPTGEGVVQDGITSRDISIPFALEKQTGWKGTVRARLFELAINDTKCAEESLPLIFFLHGGGFVLGSIDMKSYDQLCRTLARRTCALVLSVDYRLAPEHPFPNGVYDVYSAYSWVDKNLAASEKKDFFARVDPNNIIVAGDSAGGSLAIVTTFIARDGIRHLPTDTEKLSPARFPPKYQVLIYPAVDREAKTRDMPGTYILNKDNMGFFSSSYVKDPTFSDPSHHQYYLHQHAGANLTGLPDALVIAAKYDPLYGETKAYAEKLKQAGATVTYKEYESVHGFLTFDFLAESHDAINLIVQKILEDKSDVKN